MYYSYYLLFVVVRDKVGHDDLGWTFSCDDESMTWLFTYLFSILFDTCTYSDSARSVPEKQFEIF